MALGAPEDGCRQERRQCFPRKQMHSTAAQVYMTRSELGGPLSFCATRLKTPMTRDPCASACVCASIGRDLLSVGRLGLLLQGKTNPLGAPQAHLRFRNRPLKNVEHGQPTFRLRAGMQVVCNVFYRSTKYWYAILVHFFFQINYA
jgi:hypothetical protein